MYDGLLHHGAGITEYLFRRNHFKPYKKTSQIETKYYTKIKENICVIPQVRETVLSNSGHSDIIRRTESYQVNDVGWHSSPLSHIEDLGKCLQWLCQQRIERISGLSK